MLSRSVSETKALTVTDMTYQASKPVIFNKSIETALRLHSHVTVRLLLDRKYNKGLGLWHSDIPNASHLTIT